MQNQEEPEEIKESKLKKVIIIIGAIFLIFLTISYILTTPTVRSVFVGLVESSTLEESQLRARNDILIKFSDQVLEKINILHNNNKEREFKACLLGTVEGKKYNINSIYEPITFLKEYDKVIAESCQKETLISLHSHPIKHCLPSERDIINFRKFQEENSKALMIIMCEENRFNVYS